MSSKYYFSPIGIASGYPWVNKPDTKFNAGGLFKLDLALAGEDAAALRAKIEAAVEAAYSELTKDMKPVDLKKWSKVVPFTVEEDDEGRPTGNTLFHFRQNATITLKSGEVKEIKVGLKDSNNQDTHAPVMRGAEVKVAFAMRPYKANDKKVISVRLDFAAVQIIKLADRTGGSGIDFGAVEGGFVDSHDEPEADNSGNDKVDF